MKKVKGEASFQQLIDMCNLIGWDKGLLELQKIVDQTENAQAFYYGGSYDEIKQAQKLSKVIVTQNMAIARLKQYRDENKL